MKESTLDRQRRVLVIGNNTVDLVFRMPGTISPDRKSQAESLAVYAGGQAANVAHGLAILGIPVEYVGAFGDDEDSALSRRSLEDVGMSLTGSISVPGCPAHRAAILVDSLTGSRSIVMYKDKRLHLTAETITPELVAGASLVYLDNHEGSAAAAAADLGRARGLPVVADLEEVSECTLPVLSRVSDLIAPLEVLRTLTGEMEPLRVLRAAQGTGPRAVVATLGADGAVGVDGTNAPARVPGRQCAVVDSTGAGDAFHAGYVAGLVNGADFASRLQFGTVLAALKCGVAGPRLPPDRAGAACALANGGGLS